MKPTSDKTLTYDLIKLIADFSATFIVNGTITSKNQVDFLKAILDKMEQNGYRKTTQGNKK